ncbi:site-specific integrase [Erysipelothrix anatis]|uniref:site-specific integrase n=1 Tax=Erysipelothrix anatis TaxID=2683713 RepID=UPI00135783EA
MCKKRLGEWALFTFYYDTGTTLSEALAVTKSDLHKNIVSIVDLLEDKNTHKRLKNRFRRRKITLAPKTMILIEPLLSTEGQYLFGGIEPLSPRTVPRKLQYYMNIANSRLAARSLPELPRITIHGFRHSHATNLINNGVNIVSVSKRLGHSNIQKTLTTYTHLLDKNESELIDILEEL